MTVHKIRLAGPWELCPWVDATVVDETAPPGKLDVPRRPAVGGRARTRVSLPFVLALPPTTDPPGNRLDESTNRFGICRGFHRPSGLRQTTRVRIVLEVSQPELVLHLNGRPLKQVRSSQMSGHFLLTVDVGPQLDEFNELAVLIAAPQLQTSPCELFSAALEIQED